MRFLLGMTLRQVNGLGWSEGSFGGNKQYLEVVDDVVGVVGHEFGAGPLDDVPDEDEEGDEGERHEEFDEGGESVGSG